MLVLGCSVELPIANEDAGEARDAGAETSEDQVQPDKPASEKNTPEARGSSRENAAKNAAKPQRADAGANAPDSDSDAGTEPPIP